MEYIVLRNTNKLNLVFQRNTVLLGYGILIELILTFLVDLSRFAKITGNFRSREKLGLLRAWVFFINSTTQCQTIHMGLGRLVSGKRFKKNLKTIINVSETNPKITHKLLICVRAVFCERHMPLEKFQMNFGLNKLVH